MAASRNKTERVANQDIRDTIYWFYTTIREHEPDSSHYASAYKTLEKLMFPQENTRTYTAMQIVKVLEALMSNNIEVDNLGILFYPDLVRSFVDDDIQKQRIIVENLKDSQMTNGIYTVHDLDTLKPVGW